MADIISKDARTELQLTSVSTIYSDVLGINKGIVNLEGVLAYQNGYDIPSGKAYYVLGYVEWSTIPFIIDVVTEQRE